jgi:hypothetical protein
MKTYKGLIKALPDNGIFVFGSNPQGIHGAGAAAVAKSYFGAKYGQGYGLMGQSYGIVTKDLRKRIDLSVPSNEIEKQIKDLYNLAEARTDLDFYIAYSSKGSYLSGYTPEQMANMFSSQKPIPPNVIFEEGFSKLLN